MNKIYVIHAEYYDSNVLMISYCFEEDKAQILVDYYRKNPIKGYEDWYYNYALYIFNLYNQPTQNVSLPFSFGALGTILGGTNVNDYWSLPANRMLYYTT